jgi:hypothetical protein
VQSDRKTALSTLSKEESMKVVACVSGTARRSNHSRCVGLKG